MHFYQFNIGDYVSSTQHLDPLEDLAYRRMLDLYYSKELPLPKDIDRIAKLIRMRSHTECIESVLLEFFELTEDGYRNHGADKVLDKTYRKSESARKSARARWSKNKDLSECERNANAMQDECVSDATQYPKHNTQNTESRFLEFWNLYNKKNDRSKCESKFKKLKKSDIDLIFERLPEYIKQTPDKQYRKNPATWLNGKCWLDESLTPNQPNKPEPVENQMDIQDMLERQRREIAEL